MPRIGIARMTISDLSSRSTETTARRFPARARPGVVSIRLYRITKTPLLRLAGNPERVAAGCRAD